MVDIGIISQICLVHHLRRAARRASQRLDRALEPLGLQASQFTVLCLLAEKQPVTAGELARALGMDRSTLNRNLGPMSKAGWVTVGGGRGRRGLTLELTPDGEDLLFEAAKYWRDVQQELSDQIGAADAGRLISLLERVSVAD